MIDSSQSNIDNNPDFEGLDICTRYNSLTSEYLKLIELRQQILSYTITIAGAILSIGLIQTSQNNNLRFTSVALIYPPIATCLALVWAQHSDRIKYIEKIITKSTSDSFVNSEQGNNKNIFAGLKYAIVSHSGVFLCTQLLALIVGCSLFTWHGCNTLQWILLFIDLIFIEASIVILAQLYDDNHWKKHYSFWYGIGIITIIIVLALWKYFALYPSS
jgi:hypothetical protein